MGNKRRIVIFVALLAIIIAVCGTIMISGKRNYIDRADKDLSNVMSSFGIYETAIDTYGEPQKEFVSADGIERGLVYDGITAIYRERGAVRLQITGSNYAFGPKKISVGTDKSVFLGFV